MSEPVVFDVTTTSGPLSPPVGDGTTTLGDMIRQVRQALPVRSSGYSMATLPDQGFTVTEFITRVRRVLRDDAAVDADRFLPDQEIVDIVNDGIIDVTDRTRSFRKRFDGTTPAVTGPTSLIPLPSGFMAVADLNINDTPVLMVDDDEEWNDYFDRPATQPRIVAHIIEGNLEVFPIQPLGTPYFLYYVSQPHLFTGPGDATKSDLPRALQIRVVNYAKGHALIKEHSLEDASLYLQLYEKDLGSGVDAKPSETAMQGEPREVQDFEIVDWINEGLMDISWREEPLRGEIADLVSASGTVPLPLRFLRVTELRLSIAGADGRFDVEMVSDDVFTFWKYNSGGSTPAHTIGRVFSGSIELWPVPAPTITYTLRYVSRATPLVLATDVTTVSAVLVTKAIQYARAQALYSAPTGKDDLARADRYMAAFSSGLKPATVNAAIIQGPITLAIEPGAFDMDPEAMHI